MVIYQKQSRNTVEDNNPDKGLDIERDLALFLTASIDIKGMPNATPTVASVREEDYFNALKYYVDHHPRIQRIIFVENSGWSLDRVRQAAAENPYKKEIEFISLNCNDFPRDFGKGYGEALLIQQGIANSTLLKEVKYIAKITGRIYLLNLTQLLETVHKPYDFLCDFKTIGWVFKRLSGVATASPHCDTRFFVVSQEFYKQYLLPLHQNHQEGGFSIEARFYQALKNVSPTEKIVRRFSREPKFRGIAGHFQGKNYDSSSEQVKWKIRDFARKVIPWLYL